MVNGNTLLTKKKVKVDYVLSLQNFLRKKKHTHHVEIVTIIFEIFKKKKVCLGIHFNFKVRLISHWWSQRVKKKRFTQNHKEYTKKSSLRERTKNKAFGVKKKPFFIISVCFFIILAVDAITPIQRSWRHDQAHCETVQNWIKK